LWFFNFVNSQLAKTYDADSKKKVVPELMPRALFWFRWGAAWTFITGIVLFGLVYSMGGALMLQGSSMGAGAGTGIALGILVVGFLIYDVMWKSMAKNEMVGAIISLVLVTGVAFGEWQIFTGRAVFIQIGALFGTIMAANVWMRIWPNQRKIIAAIKGGTAPDAAIVGLAGLRSKHNTYMSFPLMFLMISNHYPGVYGHSEAALDTMNWAYIPLMVAIGWILAKRCFSISGTASPAQF
jgi:uncharacterized membrane protein